ncbi:hypothetical protein HN51_046724 [Arachis hypogaea]
MRILNDDLEERVKQLEDLLLKKNDDSQVVKKHTIFALFRDCFNPRVGINLNNLDAVPLVAGARGEYVRWNNFLGVLPHPQGLGPLFTGQWNLYAQNPDFSSHLFGTPQGAGTAILTLLGGFHPQTQSLWLTDIAHHHLAIAILFLIADHIYSF